MTKRNEEKRTDDFDKAVLFRDCTYRVLEPKEGEERGEIEIAISSETPVSRYDWMRDEEFDEILGHGKDEIDLTRAKQGLALLVDHGRTMVGRVEKIRLDDDKVLRGIARFGSHPDAAWIERDMRAGIRPGISAGYERGDYEEKKVEGRRLRRYKWSPMEVSSVAIPADIAVGVGRDAAEETRTPVVQSLEPHKGKEQRMKTDSPAPTGAEREPDKVDLGKEKAALLKLAQFEDRAHEIMSDSISLSAARDLILEWAEKRTKEQSKPNAVVLTDKEQKRYSVLAAINSLCDGKREGFEFEVSDEVAKRLSRDTAGFYMPTSLAVVPRGMRAQLETRTQLAIGTSTKGQELLFTEYGGFIDMLRSRPLVMQFGARMLSGLVGNVAFVRQVGASTAGWVSTETGTQAASSLTLETRTLSPKNIQAWLPYSRQFLRQSVEAVEPMIRSDVLAVHSRLLDLGGLAGSGGSGQPRGILNTTSIGSVTGGANGANPDWADIVDLQREVAVDNALFDAVGYMTTPGIAARLMKTEKFGSTNGKEIWEGKIADGILGGYRAAATTQVPSNLTKGTSTTVCHALIFGSWDQLIIGEWGAIEYIVDIYSNGPSNIIVKTYQLADVLLRHPEAFAAMQDALQ